MGYIITNIIYTIPTFSRAMRADVMKRLKGTINSSTLYVNGAVGLRFGCKRYQGYRQRCGHIGNYIVV